MKSNFINRFNVERWHSFSFEEQMGHIGCEITRARNWKIKSALTSKSALSRALDLIEITQNDPKVTMQHSKTLLNFRAIVENNFNSQSHNDSLEVLDKHCLEFALVARKDK